MEEQAVIQNQTSDDIDAPTTPELAQEIVAEEVTPVEETVTLTKAELQEQKNAVAKKERERAERKSSREIQALRDEFNAYKTPPKVAIEGKPTLDQFDSYDEYTEAITDWKLDQRDTVRQQTESKRAEENRLAEAQKSFTEKSEKFRAITPDYDDVMAEIADVELSQGMNEAVIGSDLAAQLAYYFGKNPDEFERINELSPMQIGREIGKLEAKLATDAPKPPKQSNAPEPIKPVGASKSTVTPDVNKMSDAEWDKWDRENKRKKG